MSSSGGPLDRRTASRPTSSSIDRRPRQRGAGEDPEEALAACTSSCPGTARRPGCPRGARPRATGSPRATTAGTSRGRRAGRRADRGPRRPQRPDRVRQLVQRVLEVDEVELGVVWHRLGVARLDPDPGVEAGVRDVAHRPGDRVRLELDADERRRRETAGRSRSASLPPPHATSRTRPPAARRAARSGSWARPSWKKTAMSWTVTASIARWNRGGRSAIGWPVRKKSGSAA